MKLTRRITLVTAAALLAGACEDSTGITIADLAGTWHATKFEYTPHAGGSAFDVIANGGTVALTLATSGAVSGTLTFPGQSTENFSGTAAIQGNTLTLTFVDEPDDPTVFTMTLSGNTLTLTASDDEFDFNFDGEDEPATLTVVLVRQ